MASPTMVRTTTPHRDLEMLLELSPLTTIPTFVAHQASIQEMMRKILAGAKTSRTGNQATPAMVLE